MKTIEDIKVLKESYLEGKEFVKSTDSKIVFYNLLIMYLGTNPKEESIIRQLDRLKKHRSIIDSRFDEWTKGNPLLLKKIGSLSPKAYYRKINGYGELKAQIRTLEFLLQPVNL